MCNGKKILIVDDDNLFSHRGHAVDLFQGMIDHGLSMPWATISTAVFRLDAELVDHPKGALERSPLRVPHHP